jgi:hypothetical protein
MKNLIISFLSGLTLGIIIVLSFQVFSSDDSVPSAAKIEPKTLKKEVAKSEVGYMMSMDSLKKKSVQLGVELKGTKLELEKTKQKNRSLQTAVYKLLDKQPENDLNSSEQSNGPCDSLINAAGQLIQSSTEKDSLYDVVTSNLEEQLKNKDSTISLKDEQYKEIKAAFTKSIEDGQELLNKNKQLQKQAKRQKRKSKIISAALMILTGDGVKSLIHH